MSDPYVWFDPFAEQERAERAERRAAISYQEGQQAVLRDIAGRSAERFGQVLRAAVTRAAEEVVRKHVQPHMAKSYDEVLRLERRVERERNDLERSASPRVAALEQHGRLSLGVQDRDYSLDASYVLKYEVLEPFRFNVAMDPIAWRTW